MWEIHFPSAVSIAPTVNEQSYKEIKTERIFEGTIV
jgi:hypothetical protein